MPVAVSYPGLYLEELPSSSHSIVAAPTSIAVFVGYTHPFRTRTFGTPVRIFGFSDYEREFGGLYASAAIDASVAHAVNQFFLNGGSDTYVVGILPRYQSAGGAQDIDRPTTTQATNGGGIVFTGREPTDSPAMAMTVTISNIRAAVTGGDLDTADFTITYGTRVETYRGLSLTAASLEGAINERSALIEVSPLGGNYGTKFTANKLPPRTLTMKAPPAGFTGTFSAGDFTDIFGAEKPLDKVDIFNLLLVPGVSDNGVLSAALAFAERKQAFVIIDPPRNAGADSTSPTPIEDVKDTAIPLSQNGAIYFPYLKSTNPLTGNPIELPPGGFVAGIYARTDTRRGVWKAPAGIEAVVNSTTGVVDSGRMNDPRQGVLNLRGINCIRSFPGLGTVVFGARTLVGGNPAFQQNWYVPVRRMTLFIEQTLLQNLKWVVFEPNDTPLWISIRTTIENFLLSLFNQGALQGTKPSDAFQVKCDSSTTTPDDVATGKVNIVVAFAPLRPAEFVIIKIAQLAGQTQS